MMQCEFEKILGEKVTESDYRMIEVVYMWHPSNLSKEAVASLYKDFGMALIKDMIPRADKMKEFDERLKRIKNEEFALKKLMEAIKQGEDLARIEELEKGVSW